MKSGKKPFSGLALKVFLFIGILAVLFIFAFYYLAHSDQEENRSNAHIAASTTSNFIPEGNLAEVVEHQYYVLGYNETTEQADWVAYELTKEDLKIPNVPRSNRFEPDRDVSTGSAKHSDYSRSGYSRGHMAPAGDMAFNETAMQESFLMSNMSPQISGFNGGIWRELEECARDWAYQYEHLLVISGPAFGDVTKYIGKSSKVRVPQAFYKIIVDIKGPDKKGIGFIIPHEISERQLSEFAMTVDQVEETIHLDFFDQLYDNYAEEQKIEGKIDIDLWPISQKRYQTRIKSWNKN